jgi:transmembrane sensor
MMESEKKETSSLDAAAADWVARMESGPLSAEDQLTFESWWDTSVHHRGAYARAEAALALAGHAIGIGGERPMQESYTPTVERSPVFTRRKAIWAASAAAAAGVFAVYYAPPRYKRYSTERGEVRIIPLEDGTAVTLNTASEVAVRYMGDAREVRLVRGEALFDVVRDSSRPFTVYARNAAVRAVGTSFLVKDLINHPVEVIVREGAVDMFHPAVPSEKPTRVITNYRAVALDTIAPSISLMSAPLSSAQIERQLSWQRGMMSFEGERLKDAVAEFSRYSDVNIVIADPAVGDLKVTGVFSIHNPIGFARSAALVFSLQIAETPKGVTLWR